MYETIVVPTDGSDHAVRASDHARTLAALFDAELHVLAVADVQGAAGPFDAGGVDEAFIERLETQGQEAIDTIVARTDRTVETTIRRGGPTETILEYAEEVDADLLAMGTHGRTGLHRYIAGSVTEGVVRLADRPVLTARAGDDQLTGYDELLLPTDGSGPAQAAIEHAIAVAQAGDARIHAVSVVDIRSLSAAPTATGQLDRLKDASHEATDEIVDQASAAGVEVTSTVIEGFPARDLLGYADEHDIDLITMGTHGRTGIDRYLLGSTTERMIRHADQPVIAISSRE
jgi:nucleotide-binding universal stress UspA family protein